jgi:hypothetical protein
MSSIWDYEAVVSRRGRRTGRIGWTRRAIFEGIPSAQVESLIPADYTPWPGTSGQFAPVLIDSDVYPDWRPRPNRDGGYLSRVVLTYRPMTCWEWLEQHPNKGILLPSSAMNVRRVRAVGTDVIEGPDPADEQGLTKLTVTSGTNIQTTPRPVFEIAAIVDDQQTFFFQFLGRVGMYNAAPMLSLPLTPFSSDTGRFMLTGMSSAPRPGTTKRLFDARYRFTANLDTNLGFADPCVSTVWQTITREVDALDEDDNVVGTKYVVTAIPVATRSRVLLSSTTFVEIETMLLNSW